MDVLFRTFADPMLNAVLFGSVVDDSQWNNITDQLQVRLSSTGLQTELETLRRKF